MKITIEEVKEFAWQQMDGMWHDGSGLAVNSMVKFSHKKYWVVNPWMDEKTRKSVDPYKYYGKRKTEQFIEEAIEEMTWQREHAEYLHRKSLADFEVVNHFNYATESGKVFCKRQHKVRKIVPKYRDCNKCPYLFGSLQGQGVECMWEDIVPPPSPFGYYVRDPQEEFTRVSSLIDKGILKKG